MPDRLSVIFIQQYDYFVFVPLYRTQAYLPLPQLDGNVLT